MVRICDLYSLGSIRPYYYLNDDNEVVNTQNGSIKKVWISVRGYPTVTLQCSDKDKGANVPMHKLVALARINNGPYEVIEHIDDNKLDYRVENLKFSTQRANTINAFKTGKHKIYAKKFALELASGSRRKFVGTMKEIRKATGIPLATLYDRLYHPDRTPNKGCNILSITKLD